MVFVDDDDDDDVSVVEPAKTMGDLFFPLVQN